jgi:hypothetical protein
MVVTYEQHSLSLSEQVNPESTTVLSEGRQLLHRTSEWRQCHSFGATDVILRLDQDGVRMLMSSGGRRAPSHVCRMSVPCLDQHETPHLIG